MTLEHYTRIICVCVYVCARVRSSDDDGDDQQRTTTTRLGLDRKINHRIKDGTTLLRREQRTTGREGETYILAHRTNNTHSKARLYDQLRCFGLEHNIHAHTHTNTNTT